MLSHYFKTYKRIRKYKHIKDYIYKSIFYSVLFCHVVCGTAVLNGAFATLASSAATSSYSASPGAGQTSPPQFAPANPEDPGPTPGSRPRDHPASGPIAHAAELINSFEANSDVEAQVKGDYPPLERQESLPLGAIQHAWDRAGEMAGVYTVNYHPHKVIRLRIREFMTTSIILPQWEAVESTVCGDKSAFQVQVLKTQPHILLIEPGAFIGTDTTLTAFSKSGNVYVFYLRGEGYNSKNVSDVAVYIRARHVYQTGDGKLYQAKHHSNTNPTPLNDKIPDYLEEVIFDPSKLSFAFNMAGDPDIAPERVYSDGIHTWFDYGAKIKTTTLPTIYNVIDGIDTPINVNREGTKLVAQAAGSFTLRSGQKVTCVYPSSKAASPPMRTNS